MVTYIYNKLNIVDSIIFQEEYLSEKERNNERKIQLEDEYIVPKKDGFIYELYVEDGFLKHRYIKIPKTESEEIEAVKTELLAVQKATAEIFELMSSGGNV